MSFTLKYQATPTNNIMLIGDAYGGLPVWYDMQVKSHKRILLCHAVVSGKSFIPSDYGEVIRSGWGEPPESFNT